MLKCSLKCYYYFNEILKKECRRDRVVPFLSLLNLFPRNMPKGSRQTTRYRFKPKADECLANLSMHCPSFIHGSWWQPIVIKVLNPRAKSWSPAEDERITYIYRGPIIYGRVKGVQSASCLLLAHSGREWNGVFLNDRCQTRWVGDEENMSAFLFIFLFSTLYAPKNSISFAVQPLSTSNSDDLHGSSLYWLSLLALPSLQYMYMHGSIGGVGAICIPPDGWWTVHFSSDGSLRLCIYKC